MLRRNDTKGKIFYLLTALLLASAGFSQTAGGCFERGLEKHHLQDYKGAIADYSRAILSYHTI